MTLKGSHKELVSISYINLSYSSFDFSQVLDSKLRMITTYQFRILALDLPNQSWNYKKQVNDNVVCYSYHFLRYFSTPFNIIYSQYVFPEKKCEENIKKKMEISFLYGTMMEKLHMRISLK